METFSPLNKLFFCAIYKCFTFNYFFYWIMSDESEGFVELKIVGIGWKVKQVKLNYEVFHFPLHSQFFDLFSNSFQHLWLQIFLNFDHSITIIYALTSCGHEASLGFGDDDSKGRCRWLICDILARWLPFSIIWCVGGSWVAPIVGLPPDVVVTMTSLDDCDDDVELMRVGELTRILNGDTWDDGWLRWWCNSVCWLLFACPLVTQAIIAAMAALCGSWGCGRIKPTGKLYPGWPWESVVDVPVCVDDGVIPMGGEWVGDALSPMR